MGGRGGHSARRPGARADGGTRAGAPTRRGAESLTENYPVPCARGPSAGPCGAGGVPAAPFPRGGPARGLRAYLPPGAARR